MAPKNLEEKLDENDPLRRLNFVECGLRPPEPQLLGTCVVQNLDWVDRRIEAEAPPVWDAAAVARLKDRYGDRHANDLVDLGTLYKPFEHRGSYPWLVCVSSQREAAQASGPLGHRLRELIGFFRGHQEDWCREYYAGLAHGLLFPSDSGRVSPLILQALNVSSPEEVYGAHGPLSFLPDQGDRLVAATALMANIPAVLTTDCATFWEHRGRLRRWGLRVMRPTELLQLYLVYWAALEREAARRCDDVPAPRHLR